MHASKATTSRKLSIDNSTLNADFALHGISLGHRVDGRAFGQRRPLSFEFGAKDASVVVRLGGTVVAGCVAARIEPPMHSRSNEGSLRCIVRDATFMSGQKQSGEQREVLQLYERFLDRSLKESKAVDLESLCIQAGKHVWYVELQLTIMNDDGNVVDALGWAALAALRVFKREEVERPSGQDKNRSIKVHRLDEREGVGMTIHSFPVAVTFAVYDGIPREGQRGEDVGEGEGDGGAEGGRTAVLVDPTAMEEGAASGSMTVSVTPQGELCAVQKADGCGMAASEVFGCLRRGKELADEGCRVLDEALKKHAVDRVAARVKKHDGAGGGIVVSVVERGKPTGDAAGRALSEDVRKAMEASKMEDDAGPGDAMAVVDNAGGGDTSGHDNERPQKKKKKTGRRYAEGKAGKEVYRQASDAVRGQAAARGDGEVESLRDALK